MLNLRLKGLEIEKSEENYQDSYIWGYWGRLLLFDQKRKMNIPEYFYVVACTEDFFAVNQSDYEAKDIPINAIQIQTGQNCNELDLTRFAREKFDKLNFANWDDFYRKMEKEFIYDD